MKPIKKIFLSIIGAVVFAGQSFGLTFVTKVTAPDKAYYSKTDWVSSAHINPVPLKGTPARNDSVTIQYYKGDFIIDKNLEVRSFGLYEDAKVIVDNKKINVLKGGLHFALSGSDSHTNLLWLKNGTEIFGSGMIEHHAHNTNDRMGMDILRLENSKITLSGNMMFMSTAARIKPTAGRSGVNIELIGNSQLQLKGDIIVDSLLEDEKKLHFKISFEERDGKLPMLSAEKAMLGGVDLNVDVKSDIKGKYTLLNLSGRKPYEGKLRSITINGKKAEFGVPVEIGLKKYTLSIGAEANSKKKSGNDIILSVE